MLLQVSDLLGQVLSYVVSFLELLLGVALGSNSFIPLLLNGLVAKAYLQKLVTFETECYDHVHDDSRLFCHQVLQLFGVGNMPGINDVVIAQGGLVSQCGLASVLCLLLDS